MTARPIRRNAQTPDRNGKIFYTSTTSLSHISKQPRHVMEKAGFVEKLGEENFCENIDVALAKAATFDN